MIEIARPVLTACALLLSCELAAQTFKCVDANGRITYSGKKCSDLGLKDAGEVKDLININPAYRPPAQSSPRVQSSPAPVPEARIPEAPPATEEADKAERRCFTVNTAKGKATRCNDTPPE